jgi:hypothetical protein
MLFLRVETVFLECFRAIQARGDRRSIRLSRVGQWTRRMPFEDALRRVQGVVVALVNLKCPGARLQSWDRVAAGAPHLLSPRHHPRRHLCAIEISASRDTIHKDSFYELRIEQTN